MLEILYVLAAWRLTNIICSDESGPWNIFDHVRAFAARNEFIAKLAKCPLCTSIWMSGFLTPLYWYTQRPEPLDLLAVWLGISGGTSLIYIVLEIGHKLTRKEERITFNHEFFAQSKTEDLEYVLNLLDEGAKSDR